MPTDIQNLKTRRSAIYNELAALSSTAAGGKPNQSGAGTGVDHVGYKDGLYRELREIEELLDRIRNDEDAGGDGAWEVTSEAVP